MAQQEFSPLRSRAARKPWPECPDVSIYRCNHCNRLFQTMSFDEPEEEPVCCDSLMIRLEPREPGELAPEIFVDYEVVGGFNCNAVQVFWDTEQPEDRPQWILLKTFTGGYLKYIPEKKAPPVVFPLSDEDAYVYCDRAVCERCVFNCKKGFAIYLYFGKKGLLEVPMDRMSDYFKAKPTVTAQK